MEYFYSIPFVKKPLPKNPFGIKTRSNQGNYIYLHKEAIKKVNPKVENFEERMGFSIDKKWFSGLSLQTQTCIKKSELNFNHGRLLYSILSRYIKDNINSNIEDLLILETGTARGFSSLCMAKALIDNMVNGKIITLDCIGHNEKIYWNSISDFSGKKTRNELLSQWEKELSKIIFIQGWTIETLKNLGLKRINFAFLDAQHTKKAVMSEFEFVNKHQSKGDLIFFDDVTPMLFDGVCDAVKEIESNYPYEIEKLDYDKKRGYALAKKI